MRYLTIFFIAVLAVLVGPSVAQSAVPAYQYKIRIASDGAIWGIAARPVWLSPGQWAAQPNHQLTHPPFNHYVRTPSNGKVFGIANDGFSCWLTPELYKQLGYPKYTEVVAGTIMKAYVTGYGYWDNTPPGSSAISNPVLHQVAGGVGSYANPITVAVGHSITTGVDTLDVPPGTRFYVPNERRYFIVEDACGDGLTPQDGPCHSLAQADPGAEIWIDIWVGGANGAQAKSDACESNLTGIHTIIKNPASNYMVTPGDISGPTCSTGFGETLVGH